MPGSSTAAALIAVPGTASAADYVPGQVVVGYAQPPTGAVTANVARAAGAEMTQAAPAPAPDTQVVKLKPGVTVTQALRKLRRQRGVAYAVPNYLAHASGSWVPNDPGQAKLRAGGSVCSGSSSPGPVSTLRKRW